MRNISADELKTLAQTMTSTAMANHLGVPRSTLGGWLTNMGIKPVKAIVHEGRGVKAMPDLETLCLTMNKTQLARHYSVRLHTITRRLMELGLEACTTRITDPEGGLTGLRELAATMHLAALGRHFKTSAQSIARRLDKLGITAAAMPKAIPPEPKDRYPGLDELAPTMHMSALSRHYGVSTGSMHKVLKRRGLTAAKAPKRDMRAMAQKGGQKRAMHNPRLVPFFKTSAVTDHKPKSEADLAADHLRRLSSVWRCTEDGKPDVKGTFWRRGSAILTDAELIARAVFRGFDASAWKQCVA